ncbi:hypothetical protein C8R45DRAFT_937418 [Mycena sanguinolenta]|nr:hypothetical protein C8R45DRAFT_937418 [Mycena sanguinolenta]
MPSSVIEEYIARPHMKQNKKTCAELLENVQQVLFAIINLHIKSEAAGSLSPAMTEHVGGFMKTLHKIYVYIEAQQDRNKLKQLFRNIEMNNLVKDCYAELDEAKTIFNVDTAGAVFKDIGEMKEAAETKHKELLESISTMSETNMTTDGLSIHLGADELKNSSNSFSLLPSKPKIFYGREAEVDLIMKMLGQQSPRIAILGGGGMGKTNNLETVWEPFQSWAAVEEFLSLLTEIQHLGLISSLPKFNGPILLSPLQPLSDEAAQQTFLGITDNAYAIEDLNQLLTFTSNMLLAVDLISHLVDYEGLENVLGQWLTSGRKELFRILSILPNRLSDAELVQSKLPIPNILSFKTALLATSLAYQSSNKRLLVLVPLREHIQQFLPPPPLLIDRLCKHFHELLNLFQKYREEQLHNVVPQIAMNLGNLQ